MLALEIFNRICYSESNLQAGIENMEDNLYTFSDFYCTEEFFSWPKKPNFFSLLGSWSAFLLRKIEPSSIFEMWNRKGG